MITWNIDDRIDITELNIFLQKNKNKNSDYPRNLFDLNNDKNKKNEEKEK